MKRSFKVAWQGIVGLSALCNIIEKALLGLQHILEEEFESCWEAIVGSLSWRATSQGRHYGAYSAACEGEGLNLI